jgi:hypothetical protein
MSQFPDAKALFSAIATLLTFVAFVPYYLSIWNRRVRPHVFSWFIWGGGTMIVFFAQLAGGGGIGAWPAVVSALLTLGVGGFALWRSPDLSIKRIDLVFLTLAAMALPLWFLTETALSAVIVLTIVDLLGFGPSVRKAYSLPHEESAFFFFISVVRNVFVLMALETLSWTTALFPAAVLAACSAFVVLIFLRRAMVSGPQETPA